MAKGACSGAKVTHERDLRTMIRRSKQLDRRRDMAFAAAAPSQAWLLVALLARTPTDSLKKHRGRTDV